MIVDCVSDLHGHYPKLEGGDLLIVAGDLTRDDSLLGNAAFLGWITQQNYKRRIFIAGNHDNRYFQEETLPGHREILEVTYLCDSGTEFEYEEEVYCNFCGTPNSEYPDIKCSRTSICSIPIKKKLKIWGSPWTKTFEGMNPHCKAFTVDTEEELAKKFEVIPHDTDILITHSPPHSILDKTIDRKLVGSKYLYGWFTYCARPKLHVFGHIHESYGTINQFSAGDDRMVKFVNASHVNERYQPVNKPIRVIL